MITAGLRVVRAFAALDRRAFAHDRRHRGPAPARASVALDRHRGDGVDVAEPPDAADQILLAFGDLKAGRRIAVRGRQRRSTSCERHLVRGEPRRVEHDLVLLLLAAGGDDLRHARHGEQPAPDDRLGDGAQLERRMPIGFEIDEQHLAHDRRHRREERRLDVRRQRCRRRASASR